MGTVKRICITSATPEEQLTLIESEVIEIFNRTLGLDLPFASFRRNILTQHIHLNDLMGKEFTVCSFGLGDIGFVNLVSICRKYCGSTTWLNNWLVKVVCAAKSRAAAAST